MHPTSPEHELAHAFANLWISVFQPQGFGEVPSFVASPCCAQFIVSKGTVLAQPLKFYTNLRNWLEDTEYENSISGRAFEFAWHIIFGKPPNYCPSERDCNCRLYGDCPSS